MVARYTDRPRRDVTVGGGGGEAAAVQVEVRRFGAALDPDVAHQHEAERVLLVLGVYKDRKYRNLPCNKLNTFFMILEKKRGRQFTNCLDFF